MPLFQKAGRSSSPQHTSFSNNARRVHLSRPKTSFWARFRPMVAFANKYVHKLLGNNSPAATRLADRAVKVVSDLSSSQKLRLQAWVDEADADEIGGRVKAAEAILKCAQTASRDLELDQLKLTSLPDVLAELTQVERLFAGGNPFKCLPESLANMDNLQHLSCDYCDLSEIPEWVSSLNHLSYLNLNGNNLTSLPDTLGRMHDLRTLKLVNNNIRYPPSTLWSLGKSHSCHIHLAQNPVPASEQKDLHKIRGAGKLRIFCFPRLSYGEASTMNIKKLMTHWFALTDRRLPDSVRQMLEGMDQAQVDTLHIHLAKLVGTKDYEESEQSVVLAKRVVGVLEEMSADNEVKNACLAASLEAVSTCADRAMLGLNEMEKAVRFAKVNKTGDLAQLVELGAGYEKLEKVKNAAKKHYKKTKLLSRMGLSPIPDEVEVQLAFMLGLAERLQLPIARDQGMLFRFFALVSDREIRKTGDAIQKELRENPEQEIEALLAWQPLKEKMEQQYFGYVDDIRGEYLEKREALDSHAPDYDEQVARIDEEMKTAIDNFYFGAVGKLRSGNPLLPRTQAQALTDSEIDQEALRMARERMGAMMKLRQRRDSPGSRDG